MEGLTLPKGYHLTVHTTPSVKADGENSRVRVTSPEGILVGSYPVHIIPWWMKDRILRDIREYETRVRPIILLQVRGGA